MLSSAATWMAIPGYWSNRQVEAREDHHRITNTIASTDSSPITQRPGKLGNRRI